MVAAPIPVLATGRVRHVGEAVAIVVAKTPQQALDAAERVELDLAPLPAAADVARALEPEAPAIWPTRRTTWRWTGPTATRRRSRRRSPRPRTSRGCGCATPRVAPSALEPRAAIGIWDAGEAATR